MHRNLQEVMTSQSKMLPKRGEEQGAHDAALVASYQKDVEKTKRLLDRRPCFDVLDVDYRAVLDNAAGEAERIAAFVGGLDAGVMAAVVDQQLYRNRWD